MERLALLMDLKKLRMEADCYNKRLGCWCASMLCHAEVIVKLAKELDEQEKAA